MKKIIALALAATMIFALCGCGAKKEETSEKKQLVVGITYFEPMNYIGDDGELTGFETEFTKAVCEKLGLEPKFQEINWDNKVFELQSNTIDVIWNGMTVNEELAKEMIFSTPYIRNRQVVVINKANADKYTTLESMAEASIAAETGSAGEVAIQTNPVLSKAKYLGCSAQKDVLVELKAGTTEIGVFDYVMAKASIGEGTDYNDLMIVDSIQLTPEEYAVGIRKEDTKLQSDINKAIKELVEDGTLKKLAEKYDLADVYAFDK